MWAFTGQTIGDQVQETPPAISNISPKAHRPPHMMQLIYQKINYLSKDITDVILMPMGGQGNNIGIGN
jgi:hypothetical protein